MTGSASDPYTFGEIGDGLRQGYQVLDGRTQVDSRLVSGQKTAVIIWAGESIFSNYDDTLYTASSSLVHNFNVYNGGIYRSKDPQLGTQSDGGCIQGRTGDKLITAGTFARVINVGLGVGGTVIADWIGDSVLTERLTVARARLSSMGITPATCNMFGVMGIGINDSPTVTDAGTMTRFEINLASFFDENGEDIKWFLPVNSFNGVAVNSFIQSAQTSLHNGTTILNGDTCDTLTGANRNASDHVHWSAAGSDAMAGRLQAKISAVTWPISG